MYVHNIPTIKYTDPWLTTFEQRFQQLKGNHQRVVYYYEKPDSSTFRYRVYNMIQSLKASPSNISASFFWGDELEQMHEIVANTDVIVICRARYTETLSRFIALAKHKRKKIFFDIDDLIFNPIHTHLVVDSLNADINNPVVSDFWFSHMGQQAATLHLCDQALTTNEYLAKRIDLHAGKRAAVIPNFLNREQVEISERIIKAKRGNGFKRNSKFHVGYFSGSPTHLKDLAVTLDALTDLLKKHENLILRIVGHMDSIKHLQQQHSTQLERFPMQDFINLQRIIGEVEINLVPLQDNEFTNCKSDLKYFEAGVVGTTTIASPTFTYTSSIIDGNNGYIAKSYEWYDKIDQLISDPARLIETANNAYEASISKYSWTKQSELIESILFS